MSTSYQGARVKQQGSASDPLWYKDAIIYELHVRAFADSNNDGIGDFPGLISKLDYLQDLGVTCLWLLPFFPSPLRDDGYDISDYLTVNPSYGTVDDFKTFLNAAHDRNMQVMVELVINHTSDQHPWFQAARHAPPGSPEREIYVWSDTDKLYEDARIIFTDTEKSNWTWDPVAKAYYWHRFFSHQPDLNFDNPRVIQEVIDVMRHWLDMGVDGLRMDAIPYLIERDGTNCENLPETHAAIKAIRKAIDDDYDGRLILAEANQWPADVRPYFGDGDECHMAFHFPLMPRIYMALRQEDRMPITEIMAQTPGIPENCQWGIFLRNHDELTLEMVSDEERDYMYLAYSADPRMRINIGIRRRLAPLVDNNRRRIELLNGLLFSFPGTPILYYGDEIGMGDNIYLGDRNGVRTPMQWSGDRNAGFSRASPAKLFSPVIMDPVWGYEAINVEAQQSDPSSLLSWMRNMISLRKLFSVFGRGTLTFLSPENRKVLAYVRQLGDQRVLCIANLSRFAQPVTLDLSEFDGMVPIEMVGYVEFPTITRQPYPVTLGPYGFFWLELQPSADAELTQPESEGASSVLSVSNALDWQSIFASAGLVIGERLLPEFLPRQRWFGAKSRQIASTEVLDWGVLQSSAADKAGSVALTFIQVNYTAGEPETYLLPLKILLGEEADTLRDSTPSAIVGALLSPSGTGVLADALYSDEASSALLTTIARGSEVPMQKGVLRGVPSSIFAELRGPATTLPPRRSNAEQSNTSIFFGDRLIMKLFRRQQPGANPDVEIGRFITEETAFRNIAPFGGSIEYTPSSSAASTEPSTIAMLQALVHNEGDGWQWTLEELGRYYESCGSSQFPSAQLPRPGVEIDRNSPAMRHAKDFAGIYLEAACTLGRRTAEMHLALATPTKDPAFAAEPMDATYLEALQSELLAHGSHAFDILRTSLSELSDDAVEMAALVLSRRRSLLAKFSALSEVGSSALRTRVHGDYHLGQVLRAKGDFILLDFEGEPARSLAERRAKQSPIKDVAGMVRSFSYAAFAALTRHTTRRPQDFDLLEPWARLWEAAAVDEYLYSYSQTAAQSSIVPGDERAFRQLLDVYLLDKALYELVYELNNRPTWVRIHSRASWHCHSSAKKDELMATHEELVENAESPTAPLGTCDVFLGIAGLTDVDALRSNAATLLDGFSGSMTVAYPGFDNGRPAEGIHQDGHVRFVSYSLPANETSATPWALAAGSQRALLTLAAETQAKVCVLLNPDLQLLSGGALSALTLPVLEKKAELVLPVYMQGRYDSLLNNSILAPLTRALYGKRVRYPLASDYAVSARLVARLLQSAHTSAHVNAGSILWPATVAATIDAPVAEAVTSAQHPARTEGLELSAVIAQLVGSVFADMEHNAPLWQRVRGSQSSLASGAVQSSEDGLQVTNPDPKHMVDSFLLGYRSLQEVWGLVLPPVILLELKRLTMVAPERFRLPDELWVRIIYDFALAFRLRTINRTHLLGALTPLYLGWVASYVNGWSSASMIETPAQRHEQLAKAFEDGKPYLVRRWRWPDRFNP